MGHRKVLALGSGSSILSELSFRVSDRGAKQPERRQANELYHVENSTQ